MSFTENLSDLDIDLPNMSEADVEWIKSLENEGRLESQPPFAMSLHELGDLAPYVGVIPDIFGSDEDTDVEVEEEVLVEEVLEEGVLEKEIYTGGKKMQFCKHCTRFSGNESVCYVHKCAVEGCEEKKIAKRLCRRHYDKISKGKCIEPGCSNIAKKVGGVCVKHGAILKKCDVDSCENYSRKEGVCVRHGAVRKRCEVDGCENQYQKGGVCIKHGAEALKCVHSGCEYARKKDGLCGAHHPTYMKCTNCQFFQVKNIGTMCGTCAGYRENSEEFKLRDLFKEWYPEMDVVFDKIIEGSCLRYRPDFFIDTKKGFVIIIEVDEFHHKDYDVNCEIVRMFNIQQAIMMPVVFIRFNPNAYKPDGVTPQTVKRSSRNNKLRATITRVLTFQPKFLPGIPEVEYLYYPDNRIQELNKEFERQINILM